MTAVNLPARNTPLTFERTCLSTVGLFFTSNLSVDVLATRTVQLRLLNMRLYAFEFASMDDLGCGLSFFLFAWGGTAGADCAVGSSADTGEEISDETAFCTADPMASLIEASSTTDWGATK